MRESNGTMAANRVTSYGIWAMATVPQDSAYVLQALRIRIQTIQMMVSPV